RTKEPRCLVKLRYFFIL
ncbi:hypothetical protein THAOC_20100, partial [Thalassiosira oceanica]